MGVDAAIDITTEDRKTVLALLQRHLPGTAAWVYGSRVKWTSRPQSDLDLVVFATPKQRRQVGDLREAFEESNLPFRVDLFVWDDVPDSFRRRIEAEHVVIESSSIDGNALRGAEPSHLVALDDLCDAIIDCPHSTPVWTPDGVIVLRSKNIRNGRLDLSEPSYTSERDYVQRTKRVTPRAGDLVITREAPMGEVCMIPAGLRCCLGQRMVLLRPHSATVDPRYLLYALQSERVQQEVRQHDGTGSTVSNLRISQLKALRIPSHRLSDQRSIADVLGTLDDKIELNRRMDATLETLARALFKSWFVDFDPVRAKMEGRDTGLPKDIADLFPDRLVESEQGEIPEGWPLVPLRELIEVNPPRPLRRGKIAPYLDMANMPTSGHAPASVIERAFGSGMRFTNGDTLMARITPCLENGKTAYVDFLRDDGIGWGSTEYIVMKSRHPLPSEFAYFLARNARFREFAIQNMSGTSGRQRVPATALSGFSIPSPSSRVAMEFGRAAQLLLGRARSANDECGALGICRDTLLPKLVSGELRLTDTDRVRVTH